MDIIETGNYFIAKIRETLAPDAIIAGGWVRDQLLKKDIKDIDIWTTTNISISSLKEIFPNIQDIQYINSGIDKRLVSVIKFTSEEYKIDIVTIDSKYVPKDGDIPDTFDFNICRCWSIGDGVLNTDPLFWEDINNNKLTYNKTENNDENIDNIVLKHLPRLQLKFPRNKLNNLKLDDNLLSIVKEKKEKRKSSYKGIPS